MSYTEKDLVRLLSGNPDLAVMGDGMISAPYEPIVKAILGETDLPITSEHEMQCAVIAKCMELTQTNPLYELIYAIPNGGYRGKSQGGKLKAEGVKAGLPDLHLPLARHGRHSLYLELKFGDNKPTEAQQWWIRRLRVEGHCVEVIWDSPDEVMATLDWYINR